MSVKLLRNCPKPGIRQFQATPSSVHEKEKPTDYRPIINVFVGDKEFPALLDTGATRSFISSEVAAYCRVVGIQPDYVRDVTTTVANGSSIPIKEIYTAPVRIMSEIMEAKLLLVSDLPINVVLGMDILRTHNFSINLQTAECFLNGRSIQARLSEPEKRGQLHAIGPLECWPKAL